MYHAVAYQCPAVSRAVSHHCPPPTPFLLRSITLFSMEYALGQFGSAILISHALTASSLSGHHGKGKGP